MANPLAELHAAGQSIWYDNIRRGLLVSGELQRLVDEDSVTGVTANPTIFEKAISGSTDYDFAIADMSGSGPSSLDVYEQLAISDVRMAADILRPVYERTDGADGFVSLEVSPALAFDTAGTIQEAKRFWADVNRPNLMIKVPGTDEGAPAVEELLALGLNVNITLLFSTQAHQKVMDAYISGLERRVSAGEPIDRVASVASFFVSRIDTLADRLIDGKLIDGGHGVDRELLQGLHGKVAIANAQIAYENFRRLFDGSRFAALKSKGAKVQRPLWASTSTKNPAYRDVLYVEELIGPDTVDTMPPQTIVAFRDHGRVARTVDSNLAEAHSVLENLSRAGLSIDEIAAQVLDEGVKSFADSFAQLRAGIDEKLKLLATGGGRRQSLHLFDSQTAVDTAVAALEQRDFVRRAWEKDPTAWTANENAAQSIKDGLGWLDVTEHMIEQIPALVEFADSVRRDGYTHALLLGMGGSSLCPEVLRQAFGVRDGYPDLRVLDSTDPRAIRDRVRDADPATTLFIVSSKSGTTTEPNDFCSYFWEKVRAVRGDRAGESFVAITDPGSPLEKLAAERGFRRTFLNQADIGGRYSALSYFGMVPAAVMGIDLAELLNRAQRMEQGCVPVVPTKENMGAMLGAAMGALARAGRDKVTFICSPAIGSLGLWLEQLLAESTGKDGTGLIPVAGEPVGGPEVYGDDRLFVYLRLDGQADEQQDRLIESFDERRQAHVRISLEDPLDLGQEFFRWEMATATAGSVLAINAFDQPNVQESKDNTVRLLQEFEDYQKLRQPRPLLSSRGILLSTKQKLDTAENGNALAVALRSFLGEARPGDYVALMAYIDPTAANEQALDRIRTIVRDRLRVATTAGFGPRFLHSTGQLHKGGPNTGVFIQITGIDGPDIPVPERSYSFQTLIDAQALGDLQALEQHGRRVIRLDLQKDVVSGLPTVEMSIREALA